jgi:hypothetical protein
LERRSPFTFEFLQSRRRRFTRKRGILERLAGAFSDGIAIGARGREGADGVGLAEAAVLMRA